LVIKLGKKLRERDILTDSEATGRKKSKKNISHLQDLQKNPRKRRRAREMRRKYL